MNRKTSQVAKIVEGYLGRNELIDEWRTTINLELQKEGGLRLSNRQLMQIFRALNKPFNVERTKRFVGRKPFIFYSIRRK